MHPCVENVHRANSIPVHPIVTGATMVGSAPHLGGMATVRTRLGRVRFTDRDQLDTVTTELVGSVLFETPKFQGPDLWVRPSRSAMPFFVVEGDEVARVKDGDSAGETKRHDRIRSMMEGIADDPFHFLVVRYRARFRRLRRRDPGFVRARFFRSLLGPLRDLASQT